MPGPRPTSPAAAVPEKHFRRTVSFTRRGGRLSEKQQRAWDWGDERGLILDVPRSTSTTSVDPAFELDLTETFGRSAPLVVEIGSGRGDAVVHAATQHPELDFLALEVWTPGVAQTLMGVRRESLSNVRLAVVDAAPALMTMLPEHSVQELWLWFPDPWHKNKHHKRRLVTSDFAERVSRVLRADGVWRMATDWADYADQMADVVAESSVLVGGRTERFTGRVQTKFETKGRSVDRVIHDLAARPVRVSPPAS